MSRKTRERSDGARAAPEHEEVVHGLISELRMMVRSLLRSPVGKTLVMLAAAIVVVVGGTAYCQIRLAAWNKPFYDAASRRDLHAFLVELGIFGIIAGSLLALNVFQKWLGETLKLKLREGLVGDLLRDWMQPRRAFWLANAGPIGVNPDQRMHEDARKLCELSSDLGIGLLQASILFASFAQVLWVLSSNFTVRLSGHDYLIPGFMLWVAVIYASTGSLLSYWVGRSLIPRNAERYAREADLRFALVRINEHLDGIALAAGETDERRRVELHLRQVLAATARLVTGLTNLTWVTAGFGWITIIAPILVAAPLYFTGKISFGGLMMAAAAFTQAQSSLRWFVDNFSVIADWRATLLRVAAFRHALTGDEGGQDFDSRIEYGHGEAGVLRIEQLEILSPAGRDVIRERSVAIHAGDRVLIVGAPGTSKTLLFRALAGLWPWGSGRIVRPAEEPMLYLPRGTPYLPRSTLREVLAYPAKTEQFDPGAFAPALRRLGLEQLVAALDETRRWDRDLSQDEQLSLAFARILLQKPPWLVIDDALSSLEDDTLERVLDVFANELRQTSIIQIGRAAQARDPLFSHVLHLIRTPILRAVRRDNAAHV
ncbi:MAG TPA: ABC transporter ATP-binding protein/permease [Steroidobacteraceae bacterium]|nr:ABC transporter ATP-binding protein/permease [Steroidobacteraceae bacterium]